MEIVKKENCYVITPLSAKLDYRETMRIKEEIVSAKTRVGLDLSFVKDCTIDFLDEIKNHSNVSLFNISSDIFALIDIMNLDKVLDLYVSELDFFDKKRKLINRNLVVVGK